MHFNKLLLLWQITWDARNCIDLNESLVKHHSVNHVSL